jgi:hypothetical protein
MTNVEQEALIAIATNLSALDKDLVEIRQSLETIANVFAEGVSYFLNK